MNTFIQGSTMQEFSVGNAPLPQGPRSRRLESLSRRQFVYAFQFFHFNADGTFGVRTVARREIEIDPSGDSYSATATIEILNPAGALIATACATETATRFE